MGTRTARPDIGCRIEVGMFLRAAPTTLEVALVGSVSFVDIPKAAAGLGRIGRIYLGVFHTVAILQVLQFGGDDRPARVPQDAVQALGQVAVAEVEFFEDQLAGAVLRHEAIGDPVDLGGQEAPHILHQGAVALAVAGLLSRTLLGCGDHGDQRVIFLQLLQPVLAEELALGDREERGEAEGQTTVPFVDLDPCGDPPDPLFVVGIGQERDFDFRTFLQGGKVYPPRHFAILRGCNGTGYLSRPVIEPHGDAH